MRALVAALLLGASGVASAQNQSVPGVPPVEGQTPQPIGAPGASGAPAGGPEAMMRMAPPKLEKKAIPRNAWDKPDFNGVWGHDFFSRKADKIFYALPVFGGLPDLGMMQPWVQKVYRSHYDDMQVGKQVMITAMRCLPAGVPNVMMEAHAMQMILTRDELIVLVESDHQVRIVPIGGGLTHAKNVRPSWNGDSIAHWDGDTLVIDTVGLTQRSELDPMGTPHTGQLHVVERIYYDEFGRVVVETTLTDPGALVRPWTYTYHYAKGGAEAKAENVGEYACAENNRDGVITPDK